ncbi:hypothetical protein [Pseudomonas sp. HLT2-19-2]
MTLQDANHRDSAWERAANYEKEARPIRPVRKIVVKGAVDVVFFRPPSAHLVVAGENQEAIGSIKTRLEGDKLVIKQDGVSISGGGANIHVSSTGNILLVEQSMSLDARAVSRCSSKGVVLSESHCLKRQVSVYQGQR